MKGLFFPALFEFENKNTLTCYEDSEIFWTNPELLDYGINCFSVGIKRKIPKSSFSLQVYPNPASTIIYFDFKNAIRKPITITIYNLLGQQVIEVVGMKTQKSIGINLNSLKKGVYFYKYLSNNKIIGSGKFIKI